MPHSCNVERPSIQKIHTHGHTQIHTARAHTQHPDKAQRHVKSPRGNLRSPPLWGVWAAKRRCRPLLPRPMAPLPSEVKLYHVLDQAAVATHPCCEPWEIRFAANGVCLLLASALVPATLSPHTPCAPCGRWSSTPLSIMHDMTVGTWWRQPLRGASIQTRPTLWMGAFANWALEETLLCGVVDAACPTVHMGATCLLSSTITVSTACGTGT